MGFAHFLIHQRYGESGTRVHRRSDWVGRWTVLVFCIGLPDGHCYTGMIRGPCLLLAGLVLLYPGLTLSSSC